MVELWESNRLTNNISHGSILSRSCLTTAMGWPILVNQLPEMFQRNKMVAAIMLFALLAKELWAWLTIPAYQYGPGFI